MCTSAAYVEAIAWMLGFIYDKGSRIRGHRDDKVSVSFFIGRVCLLVVDAKLLTWCINHDIGIHVLTEKSGTEDNIRVTCPYKRRKLDLNLAPLHGCYVNIELTL